MKNIATLFAILLFSFQLNAQISDRNFIPLAPPAEGGGSEVTSDGTEDFAVLNRAGILAATREKDLGKAEQLFARAEAAEPSCHVCRYNRARALIGLKRPAEAVAILAGVTAEHPGFADGHASLGDALSLSGDHEASLPAYRKAIALSPRDAVTLNNFANALDAAGYLREALETLDKALAAEPGLAEAHCSRGVLLFRMGKRDEALRSLREAERLAPSDPPTLSNIGVVFDSLGEKEAARSYYEKALASDPDFEPAVFNLGLISIEEGDRREAAVMLRKLELADASLAPELRKRFSSKWVVRASDTSGRIN